MSGSIVPNITQVGFNNPLQASASGGGGGGSNYPANIVCSSITVANQQTVALGADIEFTQDVNYNAQGLVQPNTPAGDTLRFNPRYVKDENGTTVTVGIGVAQDSSARGYLVAGGISLSGFGVDPSPIITRFPTDAGMYCSSIYCSSMNVNGSVSASTISVEQPSYLNGVQINNGVISTTSLVECFALATLNANVFTEIECPLITSSNGNFAQNINASTINATNYVSTKSAQVSSIETQKVNTQYLQVNQGGTYIPYLSTNLMVQGAGQTIDSDTNVPLMSTVGLSTMSFFMKSPTTNGDYKNITSAPIPPLFLGAQQYKSVVQSAPSGNVDVTFDQDATWNKTGGAITHTPGSADFVVVTPGIYQLEFHLSYLANGATWSGNGSAGIDITRAPTAEQVIIPTTATTASALNYAMFVVGTIELKAGDVINCRSGRTLTTGTGQIQCVQNTFDQNTTFTWRLVQPL